ncbi:MAG: DUF2125 domain-containing protein [Alphaproteobacteria bacterium]|nr:DUF2125 domain-containing protein [Alphaproteobacteria bacterium]
MKMTLGKVKTPLTIALTVVLVWTVGWYFLAWRLQRGLWGWMESGTSSGFQISASGLEIHGYPFGFKAVYTEPEVNLIDSDHSWVNGRWRAERAEVRISPWSVLAVNPQLTQIKLLGSQVGGFRLLGFDVTGQLDSEDFSISFDDSWSDPMDSSLGDQASLKRLKPLWRFTVSSDQLRFANGLNDDVYSLARGTVQVAAFAPEAQNSTAPSLVLSARLTDGHWLSPDPNAESVIAEDGSESGRTPLRSKLKSPVSFGGRITVNSTLPAGKFQDALEGWRASGGIVNIEGLSLAAAGVTALAAGTLTIDPEFRLLGTLVMHLPPIDPALAQLVAAKDLTPAEAKRWRDLILPLTEGEASHPIISLNSQNGMISTRKGLVMPLPDYLTIDSLSPDQE